MRLGINLPNRRTDGTAPTIEHVMLRAQLIERIGFDGIWIGETIGRVEWPAPDVLAWLTAAAAATQKVELGTAILQVPLRYPAELAQRLMTLHALSGGRFSAGLGSGSTQADFDAVGVNYADRFKLLASALPTLRALCRGERVGAASIPPWRDTAGGPPILIGSWHSGIWVERAARDYDGWMASGRFTTLRQLREGIKRFHDAGGKRALVATIGVDLGAERTPLDEDGRFDLLCGPEEAAERLHRLADLGYDDALLARMNHSDEDLPEEELLRIRALVPR